MHKVIVDEADGRMELVVPDEKLSLAIGRKGQNVRLAAQLTGWKLDIISESKFKQMEEEAIAAARSASTASTRRSPEGDVPPRLPRSRRGRRGDRSRSSAAIPGVGGAESAAKNQGERRDDDGAPPSGAHPRRPRARPSRSPNASGSSSFAASGERTVQLLEEAGYRSVEDMLREDEDKLAIRTGLGIKKARAIKQGARDSSSSEQKVIEAARSRRRPKRQRSTGVESKPRKSPQR